MTGLIYVLLIMLSGGCTAMSPSEGALKVEDPAAAVQAEPSPAAEQAAGLSASFRAYDDPKPDHRLPAKVSLCGEALDLSRRSVYERLDSEFVRVVNHPAQVALWQRRAQRYFPYIEASLKKAGLPDDLKYLAVAESDLRPWVVSPAGALGIWQFMPATARHYGVPVGAKEDYRYLPEHLFGAGQSYFKALHGRFGSWALAMAAYNSGEGRVASAMSSQGVRDYYQLNLPRETERYVYRIAAIKVVLEHAGQYGLDGRPPAAHYRPEDFAEARVTLKGPISWPQLAGQVGCDYKTLRALNPHIMDASLSGAYTLRVPREYAKNLAR